MMTAPRGAGQGPELDCLLSSGRRRVLAVRHSREATLLRQQLRVLDIEARFSAARIDRAKLELRQRQGRMQQVNTVEHSIFASI